MGRFLDVIWSDGSFLDVVWSYRSLLDVVWYDLSVANGSVTCPAQKPSKTKQQGVGNVGLLPPFPNLPPKAKVRKCETPEI